MLSFKKFLLESLATQLPDPPLTDSDGDGIPDLDVDGDGIINVQDNDEDNDGLMDGETLG